MFTGIVEELGTVRTIHRQDRGMRLAVQSVCIAQDSKIGDSICVNGVCLTVVKTTDSVVEFDVMAQTIGCSNLGLLKTSDKVNLERSLKIGQRLSGHFVSGHVDCLGTIQYRSEESPDLVLGIGVEEGLLKFISLKGSVAVDGVSLTVSGLDKEKHIFRVNIVPHTARVTTLGLVGQRDKVNIEVDMLARYIYNLVSGKESDSGPNKSDLGDIPTDKNGLTQDFLAEHGFV